MCLHVRFEDTSMNGSEMNTAIKEDLCKLFNFKQWSEIGIWIMMVDGCLEYDSTQPKAIKIDSKKGCHW